VYIERLFSQRIAANTARTYEQTSRDTAYTPSQYESSVRQYKKLPYLFCCDCLDKVNELDGKVDIIFVDGKIAANRGAMLIIKVKRINSNIKMILAEDETDKTRILEYGADEFATKPVSTESVVDKVYSMLTTRTPN